MKERIKKVRKTLGLTQESVSKTLGVKGPTVSGWEKGLNFPENMKIAFCREYNVRREWLETGAGEMFEKSEEPTPEEFAKAQGCDDLLARVFAGYCSLPNDEKKVFESIVRKIAEGSISSAEPDVSNVVVKNQVNGNRNSIVNNVSPK